MMDLNLKGGWCECLKCRYLMSTSCCVKLSPKYQVGTGASEENRDLVPLVLYW